MNKLNLIKEMLDNAIKGIDLDNYKRFYFVGSYNTYRSILSILMSKLLAISLIDKYKKINAYYRPIVETFMPEFNTEDIIKLSDELNFDKPFAKSYSILLNSTIINIIKTDILINDGLADDSDYSKQDKLLSITENLELAALRKSISKIISIHTERDLEEISKDKEGLIFITTRTKSDLGISLSTLNENTKYEKTQ